jgi:hypothetical protein
MEHIKAAINFLMPACPPPYPPIRLSVPLEQLGFYWTDFNKI